MKKLLKKIREIENYLRCLRRCLLWRLLFRLDRLLRDLLEFGWAGSWAAEAEAEASKGSGVDVILVEVVAGLVKKKWEFWCNNIYLLQYNSVFRHLFGNDKIDANLDILIWYVYHFTKNVRVITIYYYIFCVFMWKHLPALQNYCTVKILIKILFHHE